MQSTVVVLAAILGVALSACGSGWTQSGNKCFKLISRPNTWSALNTACTYEPLQPRTKQSEVSNRSIRLQYSRPIVITLFRAGLAAGREIYIGGLSYQRGPWSWSDLSPFGAYRNWAAGSEPAPTAARPCIKMNPSGQWFNNCCRTPPAAGVCSKSA
ncbi:hypothetical protein PMAYCL1PPCAC_03405 [Pristionchus mayeri]|uniref:C-type lectin domain-containing protein n=1 Tax=Pristionchus mayeri TaxID=1317129 RepID=A0AAN4ZA22_9BILA|nr:hypothetical protein PMAYCL1PPCAC_03405 [Pristionchus mayeri]